jgi:hypothetical protein
LPAPPSKKAQRRAFASRLVETQLRIARETNSSDAPPAPFVEIEGRTAPGPCTDSGSPKLAAIRRWTRLVAKDMARRFPDRQDAAIEFTFRQSLGIANAYHRRLLPADVVAMISAVFEANKPLSI